MAGIKDAPGVRRRLAQRCRAAVAKAVREGEMPMWIYLPTHPEARLTETEKQALIQGLEATMGGKGSGQREDD